MTEQYLNEETLKSLTPNNYDDFKVLSTDSYSDTEMWKAIESKGDAKMLLYCAIQTAITGIDDQTYGEFEYNGNKINVKDVYKKYGVLDDLGLSNRRIGPDELTPRRLQRFFRVQIKDFIENNKEIKPYLWRKYSKMDPQYRSITFPGAESLVTRKDQAQYLLETYHNLDTTMGTSISQRIKRALLSRDNEFSAII
jgi:hypothetical protein